MEKVRTRIRARTLLMILGAAAALILLGDVVRAMLIQLAAASVLAALALPVCRQMERRVPAGLAAALSLMLLFASAVLLMMMILPPLVEQITQLTRAIPAMMNALGDRWQALDVWLTDRQINAEPLRDGLFRQMTDQAGGLISRLLSGMTGAVKSVGKVILSPLLAFYILRDRRKFALYALLLIPPQMRPNTLQMLQTVRREMGAYIRSQLLLSLAVGALTAAALGILRTPAWLLLGVLMAVMELIPYIGPFLAGVPAVLLSLQNGAMNALWALIAIVLIQQIESTVLSPHFTSATIRMHPMAVVLLVSAAGLAAGPIGMLTVIPAAIVLRSAGRIRKTESAAHPV